MRIRKLILLAAASVAALAVSSLPAVAGDSATTFSLTGSTNFTISVPTPSGDIATGATGSNSISGQLGTVTVTDDRGELIADWKVEVSSTDFTTGTATTPEKVLNDDIGYSAGAATSSSGTGVFAPGTLLTLDDAVGPHTAATWDGSGNNSVSWNPTIEFKNLSTKVKGQYSGTITHSLTAVLTGL